MRQVSDRRIEVRLVDHERFRVRIIFQDGVVSGGNSRGIFDPAAQLETDTVFALPAKWESRTLQERGLMHQAMRPMHNAINSAFRYYIARPMFLSHKLSLAEFNLPAKQIAVDGKRFLIPMTRPLFEKICIL
ncbi:MAG: hypothetical protein JWM08_847 [Candidatus Angelobacter sp.]|nr:hypothetical protein [Candidatus Angelobacter sp.]